ncbi:hypothetical protein JTB14_014254 [Gonioctena quinquepunctata]|nr:hypothetical protein JTB14_014254 [Gonioctena quinquepunctata]
MIVRRRVRFSLVSACTLETESRSLDSVSPGRKGRAVVVNAVSAEREFRYERTYRTSNHNGNPDEKNIRRRSISTHNTRRREKLLRAIWTGEEDDSSEEDISEEDISEENNKAKNSKEESNIKNSADTNKGKRSKNCPHQENYQTK